MRNVVFHYWRQIKVVIWIGFFKCCIIESKNSCKIKDLSRFFIFILVLLIHFWICIFYKLLQICVTGTKYVESIVFRIHIGFVIQRRYLFSLNWSIFPFGTFFLFSLLTGWIWTRFCSVILILNFLWWLNYRGLWINISNANCQHVYTILKHANNLSGINAVYIAPLGCASLTYRCFFFCGAYWTIF